MRYLLILLLAGLVLVAGCVQEESSDMQNITVTYYKSCSLLQPQQEVIKTNFTVLVSKDMNEEDVKQIFTIALNQVYHDATEEISKSLASLEERTPSRWVVAGGGAPSNLFLTFDETNKTIITNCV